MMNDRVFASMRQMAWERAKGELKSMTCAMWDDCEKFEAFDNLLNEFIDKVEEEGLHE